MIADKRFRNQDKPFWAHVRTISEKLGYTNRKTRQIKVYSTADMVRALEDLDLTTDHLIDESGNLTEFARRLHDYFQYRADVLNTYVEPRLMTSAQARELYERLRQELQPKRDPPMNKQKGEKRTIAYLTAIINMILEANIGDLRCVYDPQNLTTFTKDKKPLRTLARRVDGCFPNYVNPIAVWEIKEYYHTTSFGSRVADGVYESLLDGIELEELSTSENLTVEHLLFVDAYSTWWDKGRSYLCRLIDMLIMGYVDEILVGTEVSEKFPAIVRRWVEIARQRGDEINTAATLTD